MNHLCFHCLAEKFCQWGLGKAEKGKPRSRGAHTANLQTPVMHIRPLPGGSGSGLREKKKKSNRNGFSRRRESKAAGCVISGMSFAQRPLGYASQRWPVEVTVADSRWSVSLTLSDHDSKRRSKCYTFTCHSGVNLTLLHTAGDSWNTNSFHPQVTQQTKCFMCVIPVHCPHWEQGIGKPWLPRPKEASQFPQIRRASEWGLELAPSNS